ncbi:HaeIII family restriction endonuclease [Helicobacter bizzozeronii]|nr:HaeIII family restriction endonuclease [Helicobacter bizzozeronii]
MSANSNNYGRALEYAYIVVLEQEISQIKPVEIVKNSSLSAAKKAFDGFDKETQASFKQSARAGALKIFEAEPRIVEETKSLLSLSLQKDSKGENGDVRDLLIVREDILWELGISIKRNHMALKHSRISPSIDFGQKWFNLPCSKTYWDTVLPIFQKLESYEIAKTKWRDVPNKFIEIYVPLLEAVMAEILMHKNDKNIAKNITEYFIGKFDFYKSISLDGKKITQIQAYNLHKTLNQPSQQSKPKIIVPPLDFPTRIIGLDFKPNSQTTLELYLDKGWSFSMRLHSAETYVKTSLKFDIQAIGLPTTLLIICAEWQ